MGLIQDGHEKLVKDSMNSIRKQDIRNCIDHVKKLLR